MADDMKKPKEGVFQVYGTVTADLKGRSYRVRLDDLDKDIRCYSSGRMAKNHIRIDLGDRVLIELDAYNLDLGRIIWRFKDK